MSAVNKKNAALAKGSQSTQRSYEMERVDLCALCDSSMPAAFAERSRL